MALESILLDLGAPILAKVIGQRFGQDAGDIAAVGVKALADALGVEPTRAAVEAAVTAGQPSTGPKVAAAEAEMPDLLLAQAELQRAANVQQQQSNALLLAAMDKGPPWTWSWLYAWQWFLMFLWAWTLVLVYLANAALRLTGDGAGLPAPDIASLLTLTGLYLSLHMGGHTILELMRGKQGNDQAGAP